jgi:hypothetical protein
LILHDTNHNLPVAEAVDIMKMEAVVVVVVEVVVEVAVAVIVVAVGLVAVGLEEETRISTFLMPMPSLPWVESSPLLNSHLL